MVRHPFCSLVRVDFGTSLFFFLAFRNGILFEVLCWLFELQEFPFRDVFFLDEIA